MNIQFYESDQTPKPRDEIKIEELETHVYPDRFRVFVHIRVTMFQERPNLILAIRDEHDTIVSELNIIETMHHDMEFTMHIRNKPEPAGIYTLSADVFYETRNPPVDRRVEAFEVPEVESGE